MHVDSWLVQLLIVIKKRVDHWLRNFSFELNGMSTLAHLNVIFLGSYSMLGMDWLYLQRTKVEFYDNVIECVDNNGEHRIL